MKGKLFCLIIFTIGILKSQTITGSGTSTYLSKFTGTNSIGNSTITDNGTSVSISTYLLTPAVYLYGGANVVGYAGGGSPRFVFSASSIVTQGTGTIGITSGNVGIGTTSPGNYRLNVSGGVRADSVIVNTSGADFVFDDSYRLSQLSDVEKFVIEHKHLPDIPSAEQMKNEGISVGELQTKLLQKIEELTLHMIALDKENKLLKEKIDSIVKN